VPVRKRVVLKSGVSVRITALVAIAFVAHAAAAQVTLGPPSLTTPGADEWYLRAPDSVTLYVREFGAGEPVIVLHGGWGMDHGYMLPALRGLETIGHFVIYDQRGSLRSPAPVAKISLQKHVGSKRPEGTAGSAASRTMPSQWNFTPRLRAHPCALYVVIGAQDYVDFGTVLWRRAAAQIPKLQLRVLPDAGHAAWIDQPELFRRTVAEALRASASCRA
jgi:pimeloyl-ACP methyl ester carboxylesterase